VLRVARKHASRKVRGHAHPFGDGNSLPMHSRVGVEAFPHVGHLAFTKECRERFYCGEANKSLRRRDIQVGLSGDRNLATVCQVTLEGFSADVVGYVAQVNMA
jgi:hypothetical protein